MEARPFFGFAFIAAAVFTIVMADTRHRFSAFLLEHKLCKPRSRGGSYRRPRRESGARCAALNGGIENAATWLALLRILTSVG